MAKHVAPIAGKTYDEESLALLREKLSPRPVNFFKPVKHIAQFTPDAWKQSMSAARKFAEGVTK